MKENIENFLTQNSKNSFVDISTCKECSEKFSISFYEVEKIALKIGLTPFRYKRNQSSISIQEQLKLLKSHVAIIGCGGLGGHIAENLARVGVGRFSLFDFDEFEEHNLNRQNFSNYENIGKSKVEVVKEECQKINPALHVKAYKRRFEIEKDFELIKESDVIIDALDNPALKLELSLTCKEHDIPFVHGAIAGFNAQNSTCNSLENLYKDAKSGAESVEGNLSFSASFCASIQSSEVIKVLLNKGESLKDKILISNLLENEFITIPN